MLDFIKSVIAAAQLTNGGRAQRIELLLRHGQDRLIVVSRRSIPID